MPQISSKIKEFLLDTLFPIHCLLCNKEGLWFCENCLAKIPIKIEHVCGVCEKMLTPDGRTCQSCKRESPLSAFVPATSYHEFCVSKAIHLFKYRFVQDLSTPLAELLTLALQKTELPIPELIIPIPLHQRRLRWRGFNQAALLAEYVSKNLLLADEIKYSQNILIRSRYTYPQMKIKDFQGRSKNISGAFFVADKNAIKNKNILLIDDVATTGSTIFECASVLKAAGAGEIYATVIARQEVKRRTKT